MYFAHVILSLVLLQIVATNPVSFLKPLSPENAARLASWKPGDEPMWQISGQYQGDMILTPEQRNGVTNENLLWPNRIIPYEISDEFRKAQSEKKFIIDVLTSQFARTCLYVRQRVPSDIDYVYITSRENVGCWSWIGRQGGRQELNLERNGCLWESIVPHEMLHAAGFYHQQSATERDDYVNILWENIQDGMEYNFDKMGSNVVTSFGEKYDYGSIMHYSSDAFSKNGQKTIQTTDPAWTDKIGQAIYLTPVDIRKLNKMYKCE